jgi:hypothetical protein
LFEAEGCLVHFDATDDAATIHSQIMVATAHPVTHTASRVLSADDGDDSMPVRGVSASMDPTAAPLLGVELCGSEGGPPDSVNAVPAGPRPPTHTLTVNNGTVSTSNTHWQLKSEWRHSATRQVTRRDRTQAPESRLSEARGAPRSAEVGVRLCHWQWSQ